MHLMMRLAAVVNMEQLHRRGKTNDNHSAKQHLRLTAMPQGHRQKEAASLHIGCVVKSCFRDLLWCDLIGSDTSLYRGFFINVNTVVVVQGLRSTYDTSSSLLKTVLSLPPSLSA